MSQTPLQDDREPAPFQFGLRALLYVVTAAAIVFGSVKWLGLDGAFFVGFLLLCVYAFWETIVHARTSRSRGRKAFYAFAIVMIFAVIALLLPAVGSRGPPGPRTICMNNMSQLALALLSYEQAHGSLPPAYVADEKGRPMHSWRVLILPYLDQRALYEAYDFDEPWDGPNNSKLAAAQPDLFQCPSQVKADGKESPNTSYVLVTGPGTLFPGDQTTTLADCTDGPAYTIMLVEVRDSGIHWMEPRDLHVTQMAAGINPPAGQGISSHHPGGVNVAFADRRVVFLNDTIDAQDLRKLITPAGGETLSAEFE